MRVTGSTAGIGLATAAGLFREGASVVVNGRTQQRVEGAVKKVKEVGGDVEVTGSPPTCPPPRVWRIWYARSPR